MFRKEDAGYRIGIRCINTHWGYISGLIVHNCCQKRDHSGV